MAEIVRRRSWGGVLPLGRHVSISGSRSIHAPSVSIAPSSFQEEQNARHHKQFKLEQALVRVGAFIALMLIVGRRLIPWVLHYVAHTGSRELFRLAVLVMALGVAFGSAELFGVSFALGAFFAGMILAESPLSQRAAQESLPLRDAFAVLFFVSIGMLFDPMVLVTQPGPVLATFAIIVVGNALAAIALRCCRSA